LEFYNRGSRIVGYISIQEAFNISPLQGFDIEDNFRDRGFKKPLDISPIIVVDTHPRTGENLK